jgi:hypothetical protein
MPEHKHAAKLNCGSACPGEKSKIPIPFQDEGLALASGKPSEQGENSRGDAGDKRHDSHQELVPL